MKRRTGFLPAAVFVFALLLPSLATAVSRDYSADMAMYANQKQKATGKIYVSGGDKIRVEMMEPEMRGQVVSIVRMDKKIVWILMPGQKMYMENPLRPEDMAAAQKMQGEVDRKYLGEETIEGRPAKKYRITYKYEGKTGTVYSWIDDALGVPVKVSDEKGKWMVLYKNLKPGSQPEDLFEIPSGYKKMPSFGISPEMFKNRGQTEQQESPAVQNTPAGENKSGIKLPGGIKIPKFW